MSKKGVWADPKKVAVICEWPVLKNITEVHSFLGFVNYYRRFLKGYVKIARLLYDLSWVLMLIGKESWTTELLIVKRHLTKLRKCCVDLSFCRKVLIPI